MYTKNGEWMKGNNDLFYKRKLTMYVYCNAHNSFTERETIILLSGIMERMGINYKNKSR